MDLIFTHLHSCIDSANIQQLNEEDDSTNVLFCEKLIGDRGIYTEARLVRDLERKVTMAFNSEFAQRLHRHEVMWVDKHIGVPGESEVMKNRFRRVAQPLHTFTEVKSAEEFILEQKQAGKSVFLIISGQLARELVPKIFDLDCVVRIFLYCAIIKDYIVWGIDYIDKMLMFDFDEDLLIRLTNEIAIYLEQEAERRIEDKQDENGAGLLDWAAWLYNDAFILEKESCRKILESIRKRRQKLNIDHQIVYPNQFNS